MRVITGTARGMKLLAPEGLNTRPTREAVKEAIFSMIQFETEGARVLDLFAGSGQMGIEALSRSAASCVFTDTSPEAVKIIKENLNHTKLMNKARVACCDWTVALRNATFDIAFVDPPYAYENVDKLLYALVPCMSDGGVIVFESDPRTELPEKVNGFKKTLSRRYGKSNVTLYRKDGEE